MRGFKKDEMSLEIMLLKGGFRDEPFKTIGVVGLPGVGKTALCRFILRNERVKSCYTQMFWISLWNEAEETEEEVEETEEVVEEIEDTLPGDIIKFKSDVPHLLRRLSDHQEKLAENKYLIVLDDVGEAEEDSYYEDLNKCFSDEHLPKQKGGAVIVTCRSEEAAKKVVGDDNLHRLQPLNDPNRRGSER